MIATWRGPSYLGAMTLPNAKWLDFLKVGIPTFIGLAAFAAATLYLNRIGPGGAAGAEGRVPLPARERIAGEDDRALALAHASRLNPQQRTPF